MVFGQFRQTWKATLYHNKLSRLVYITTASRVSIGTILIPAFHIKVYDRLLCDKSVSGWRHEPLTGYVKLWVAHALGTPGTFSPPSTRKLLVRDLGMHHVTCVTHVPWCMSGSLTSGGGENVPGIAGACANQNFTYLVRGPWSIPQVIVSLKCDGNHKVI